MILLVLKDDVVVVVPSEMGVSDWFIENVSGQVDDLFPAFADCRRTEMRNIGLDERDWVERH